MSHICCPWNCMFNSHRAEITVMQFTGHSPPVHQSMTVLRDFTLSHIVSQARLRQWNMQLSRLWNSMFFRVEGQYTTRRENFNKKIPSIDFCKLNSVTFPVLESVIRCANFFGINFFKNSG